MKNKPWQQFGKAARIPTVIPSTGNVAVPAGLRIVLRSWGIKRLGLVPFQDRKFGLLPVSDLYLDCRGIVEHGKGIDRNDFKTFSQHIQKNNSITINAMVAQVVDSVGALKTRRLGESPYAKPYEICLFCAWGMNRSPTTKYVLAERLKALGYQVEIEGDDWYANVLAKETASKDAAKDSDSGVTTSKP
jgi:hypothetical protein